MLKRILKWVGIAVGALVVAVSLVAVVAYRRAMDKATHVWDVQPKAVVIPTDEESIAEGGRLFAARGCRKCHGPDAAGALILDVPALGTVYGANLTPAGVAASYRDVDWVRTVRHGIKPNGLPTQVMDSKEYQYLTDLDLGRIVAWLKARPSVEKQPPPLRITAFAWVWHGLGWLDVTTADQIDHSRAHEHEVAPGAAPEFGAYVLRLQCMGCHGETLSGGKLSGAPGLPNSCRQAAVAALTGFQSATACSQPGIPPVGTKEFDSMVTGNTSGTNWSAVCSLRTANSACLNALRSTCARKSDSSCCVASVES